jgi:hypothetical protein
MRQGQLHHSVCHEVQQYFRSLAAIDAVTGCYVTDSAVIAMKGKGGTSKAKFRLKSGRHRAGEAQ